LYQEIDVAEFISRFTTEVKLMFETGGTGETPSSLEHYLVDHTIDSEIYVLNKCHI